MVRIGHASIGENGAKNNAAGDQTGREVCIRSYYKKNWHTLLRAKDINVASRMANNCEILCENDLVGYDQNQRNSLRTELQKVRFISQDLITLCETDCSAFMSVVAECAGVAMYGQYVNGNAPTTSNMVQRFYATGMFDVLTDKVYMNSEKRLKRGDILVCNGHTVMILDDGTLQEDRPVLAKGSKGAWVQTMQKALVNKGYKLVCDSDFGMNTYNALVAFQGECGIEKDGRCGAMSWDRLIR